MARPASLSIKIICKKNTWLLRITVATDFGVNHLSPALSELLGDFPDLTVNMVLNNRYVELISEGFDIAVRIGELEDSSLRARKLTETTQRINACTAGLVVR